MPNFHIHKEDIQKILTSFDTHHQIPGAGNTPVCSRANDSFLVQTLLEVICSLMTNDPEKRKKVFTAVCENLIEEKSVTSCNQPHYEAVRQNAAQSVLDFLKQTLYNFTSSKNSGSPDLMQQFFPRKIYRDPYEENFEEIKAIASGGFGTVFKAKHRIDGIVYAVKKICYSFKQYKENTTVINEVRRIASLNHTNVVSYKNAWVQLLKKGDARDPSCQTDFDCSTPRSNVGRRAKKASLIQQTGGSNSRASAKPLSGARSDKKGFFVSTNTEESSSGEDVEACLAGLDNLSSLSFRDNSRLDFSNRLASLDLSSTVTFLDEKGAEATGGCSSTVTFLSDGSGDAGTPSSAVVTQDDGRQVGQEKLMAMLCIQMELCDLDLSTWLEYRAAGKELPFQKDARDIFRDIVRGVVHIHSKGIIHRDLKPSNIFYCKSDSSMKIGDFGLATLSHDENNQPRAVNSCSHTSNLGTLPYMAPEQRECSKYDEKVDMYSLGIILLELLVTFKTRSEFLLTLASQQLPPELNACFPQYVDLVQNLLQTDPTRRRSAQQVLDQPLLQENAEVEKRQLRLENEKLKEEMQELKELNTKLKREMQELKELNTKLKREMEEFKELNTKLKKEMEELKELNTKLKREMEEFKELDANRKKEMEEFKELVNELKRRLSSR